MERPLPGPNVMLPAISLTDPPNLDHHLAYRRKEAIWKQLISSEHKKWCLCGSYRNHFLPPEKSLINEEKSCSEDVVTGGGGDGREGEDDSKDMVGEDAISDAEL
ncbi:ORF2 [Torque teno felis virus 2]|uniref:ORF2 n=1 Tax=Torque teno felis virus 2 TaxID=2065043 RepID=A8DMP6_9VIRU|nr:ORF2 [Torque teno felis virus 2]ABU55880.1 ORF2 [Torque teno felis virus 2]